MIIPKLTDMTKEERAAFWAQFGDVETRTDDELYGLKSSIERHQEDDRFGYLGYSWYEYYPSRPELHFEIWFILDHKEEWTDLETPLGLYLDFLREKARQHVMALCEEENQRLGRVFESPKRIPNYGETTGETVSYATEDVPTFADYRYTCLGGKYPYPAMQERESLLFKTAKFSVFPGVPQRGYCRRIIVPDLVLTLDNMTKAIHEYIATNGKEYQANEPVTEKQLKKYITASKYGVRIDRRKLLQEGVIRDRAPRRSKTREERHKAS